MRLRPFHLRSPLALSALATLCWLGTPAMAQNVPGQNGSSVRDNETKRQELVTFDQFLDSHPRLAEQIHNDPSLVNNDQFVKNHPALRGYLEDHPGVREQIKENQDAFVNREELHARRVNVSARGRDMEFGHVQDRDQDQGPTRQQLREFDGFLDKHQNIAADLRQKPWLATNYEYLQAHPELNMFLNEHPELREQVGKNPSAFVTQDNRFDNAAYRRDLGEFDRFLDKHHQIDQQLREKPWLVSNYDYLQAHPDLKTFVQQHPGLQQQINQNPESVMSDVEVYDRNNGRAGNATAKNDRDADRDRNTTAKNDRDADRDRDRDRDQGVNRDRDNDTDRKELASFDQFLDRHREIAEQVRKNPSLVNNGEFVKNHPALQTYLKDHPAVREEVKENPSSFMQQEARYEHTEGNGVRDHSRDADRDRDHLHRQFGEFLGGHSEVAKQLSKDPSLVKNDEFMANHQELKDYLKSHPDVQQELMKNPQTFVNSSQKFSTGTSGSGTVKSPSTTAAPTTTEPKPKQ
jgi:hypothetical protein